MASVVDGLNEEFGDRINFVVLDIDKSGDDEYGPFIDAFDYDRRFRPGLYLIDEQGEVIEVWFGIVASDILRDAMNAALE